MFTQIKDGFLLTGCNCRIAKHKQTRIARQAPNLNGTPLRQPPRQRTTAPPPSLASPCAAPRPAAVAFPSFFLCLCCLLQSSSLLLKNQDFILNSGNLVGREVHLCILLCHMDSLAMSLSYKQGFLPHAFHIRGPTTRFTTALSLSLKLQLQPKLRRVIKMSATELTDSRISNESFAIKPPVHPTYDLKGIIKLALAEDAGDRGDVTCMATIPLDMEVEAYFLAKEDGIVAGIGIAEMIFHEVDPTIKVEWSKSDGDFVHKGLQFGKVHGRAHNIIVAERVALNFMQRMSGIATLTKAMANAAFPAYILETRKTAPGLRLLDKWAVLIGGGRNHRMGLFDMVMIKDNHISTAGGITNALKVVDLYLEQNSLQMEVEVETRTLEEVQDVLQYASQTKTSLTRIMLDNMVVPLPSGDVDISMLKEAVQLVNGRFETEASGNVTIDTVHQIGQSGVTFISSGSLTHSVKALDISLKIDTKLALEVGRRTGRA